MSLETLDYEVLAYQDLLKKLIKIIQDVQSHRNDTYLCIRSPHEGMLDVVIFGQNASKELTAYIKGKKMEYKS